jgi:hypothetical protein
VFSPDYNQILDEVVQNFYETDNEGYDLLLDLSIIQINAYSTISEFRNEVEAEDEEASHIYQRFFKDAKGNYRAYIALVAMSLASEDISKRLREPYDEGLRIAKIIRSTISLIENDMATFQEYVRASLIAAERTLDPSRQRKEKNRRFDTDLKRLSFTEFVNLTKRTLKIKP